MAPGPHPHRHDNQVHRGWSPRCQGGLGSLSEQSLAGPRGLDPEPVDELFEFGPDWRHPCRHPHGRRNRPGRLGSVLTRSVTAPPIDNEHICCLHERGCLAEMVVTHRARQQAPSRSSTGNSIALTVPARRLRPTQMSHPCPAPGGAPLASARALWRPCPARSGSPS